MRHLFRISALLLAAVTVSAPAVVAQTPEVRGYITPDSIAIGDRFDFVIEVEKDMVQMVEFPIFTPQAEGGIELYESAPVDTLERDGRRLKLRKRYRLAAFEEGRINLGVAQVLYGDKNILDTLNSSDSLLLTVGTFVIDSTSQSIYDLKPQQTLPFRFAEIRGYATWTLVVLLLVGFAVFFLLRWLRSRGQRLGDLFRPTPPPPPHVEAIQALEALHHQKLWQNGRHKEYYSALTDILRHYIDRRWEIGAMEMTSDEIIVAMRQVELPDKARMDLTGILRDADLVKFAKAMPESEQNENDYTAAYYFVEETKPVEEQIADVEERMTQN